VNDRDSTSHDDVEIPEHLLPVLDAAGELALERACEPEWEKGQRERVVTAVHTLDALAAGTCTREQIAELATVAVELQGDLMRSSFELAPLPWPMTADDADTLADGLRDRARLMRELTELCDAAGGPPPSSDEDGEAPSI
jgi:hypothetical protein